MFMRSGGRPVEAQLADLSGTGLLTAQLFVNVEMQRRLTSRPP
jgi:hypothetical protein